MKKHMDPLHLTFPEPKDYFQGRGGRDPLPAPTNVLLFDRRNRKSLQQEALQNRSHHRWVLIYNLETAGQVHVDHRSHRLNPGQVLLVMPYQFHHFTHLDASKLHWFFCTFELEPTPLLEPLRHQVVTVEKDARNSWRRVAEIWHQQDERLASNPVQGPLLRGAVLQGLLEIRQLTPSKSPAVLAPPGSRLLVTINRHLDARSPHPLSIADLAERLEVSESGLRAHFREIAGVPLGQYLRNYRINRAMSLLRTTQLPLSEVAMEAGFGSPQAFSRAFRAATGCSPRTYRRGAGAMPAGFGGI